MMLTGHHWISCSISWTQIRMDMRSIGPSGSLEALQKCLCFLTGFLHTQKAANGSWTGYALMHLKHSAQLSLLKWMMSSRSFLFQTSSMSLQSLFRHGNLTQPLRQQHFFVRHCCVSWKLQPKQKRQRRRTKSNHRRL